MTECQCCHAASDALRFTVGFRCIGAKLVVGKAGPRYVPQFKASDISMYLCATCRDLARHEDDVANRALLRVLRGKTEAAMRDATPAEFVQP